MRISRITAVALIPVLTVVIGGCGNDAETSSTPNHAAAVPVSNADWAQVKKLFDDNRSAFEDANPGPEMLLRSQSIFYSIENGDIGIARQLLSDGSNILLKAQYDHYFSRHISIAETYAKVIESYQEAKRSEAEENQKNRRALEEMTQSAKNDFEEALRQATVEASDLSGLVSNRNYRRPDISLTPPPLDDASQLVRFAQENMIRSAKTSLDETSSHIQVLAQAISNEDVARFNESWRMVENAHAKYIEALSVERGVEHAEKYAPDLSRPSIPTGQELETARSRAARDEQALKVSIAVREAIQPYAKAIDPGSLRRARRSSELQSLIQVIDRLRGGNDVMIEFAKTRMWPRLESSPGTLLNIANEAAVAKEDIETKWNSAKQAILPLIGSLYENEASPVRQVWEAFFQMSPDAYLMANKLPGELWIASQVDESDTFDSFSAKVSTWMSSLEPTSP